MNKQSRDGTALGEAPAFSGGGRIASLDIMKGFAMVMVMLVHYNQSFRPNFALLQFGQMGCQLFFVASGFGASMAFAKMKKSRPHTGVYGAFYLSRVKAIAPAWWCMMIVIYLANTVLDVFFGRTLGFGTNRSALGLLCNALFLNGLTPFCNNDVMPGGWYIGTTMLLYLITPFLYFLFEKFSNKKVVFMAITFASLGGLAALAGVAYAMDPALAVKMTENNSFGYYFVLTQLPCFAMGMLLYCDYAHGEIEGKPLQNFAVGLAVLLISLVAFFNPIILFSPALCVLLVGGATYYLLRGMILYENKYGFGRGLSVFAKLGDKSLYIYLVHFFFVWTFVHLVNRAMEHMGMAVNSYVLFFVLLPLVMTLSYLSACLFRKILAPRKRACAGMRR